MANTVLLNNVAHGNLKVKQTYGDTLNEKAMSVPVFPAEARLAQGHYPLLFAKDEQDRYQMIALFGLEQGENLFVENGQWLASYKPLMIEKGPFLIGRNQQDDKSLSIHIDLDDPKVNESEGQPLFLPHGGTTDYTDNIANVLSTLHESQLAHKEFVKTCLELGLIESFVLDVESHRLSGFHTINEHALNRLDASQVHDLHRQGYLETIYMMLASMSQLSSLIRKKQGRE